MPNLVSNSLARAADNFSLTRAVVALLLSCSFHLHFTAVPLKGLPPSQAMPSRWVSSGSFLPSSQVASLWGLTSFPWRPSGLAEDTIFIIYTIGKSHLTESRLLRGSQLYKTPLAPCQHLPLVRQYHSMVTPPSNFFPLPLMARFNAPSGAAPAVFDCSSLKVGVVRVWSVMLS